MMKLGSLFMNLILTGLMATLYFLSGLKGIMEAWKLLYILFE